MGKLMSHLLGDSSQSEVNNNVQFELIPHNNQDFNLQEDHGYGASIKEESDSNDEEQFFDALDHLTDTEPNDQNIEATKDRFLDSSVHREKLGSDQLNTEDITGLMNVLVEISFKWDELGIALGLPKGVRAQCKNDMFNIALYNILYEWIVGGHWGAVKPTLDNLMLKLAGPISESLCCLKKYPLSFISSLPLA